MKINNNINIQQVMKSYGKNVNNVKKTEKATFREDQIQISDTARDFQVAMNALNKLPEVRESKVEELKSRIQSGNYSPSASDVADKILEGVKFDKMG